MNGNSYTSDGQKSEVLQTALSALTPIVQLLLDAGINTHQLAQYVRGLAVTECSARLVQSGQKPSVSQIAAATGLARSEVRQHLANQLSVRQLATIAPRRTDRVLTAWRSEPEFLKPDGQPQPLRYTGTSPNFRELVRKHGGDIPPRAMLKEMRISGKVTEISSGQFLPSAQTTIASENQIDQLRSFGTKLNSLGDTLLTNLRAHPQQPRFENLGLAKKLTPSQATRVRRDLTRRCTVFSQGIERYLLDIAKEHPEQPTTQEGVAIGVIVALVEQPSQNVAEPQK